MPAWKVFVKKHVSSRNRSSMQDMKQKAKRLSVELMRIVLNFRLSDHFAH